MAEPTFVLLNDTSDTLPYQAFTFPRFREKLANITPNTIAIGINIDHQPVGLILGRIADQTDPDKGAIAWIHSIFIQSEYRQQGLGRALLQRMEQEIQQRNCHKIRLNYLASAKTFPLQKLLSQNGWTFENTGVICYTSKSKSLEAPPPYFLDRLERVLKPLPPDCAIFPWVELTASEREAIEDQMQTDPRYRKFTPFIEESILEPLNSLGLRQGDRVVGWMITHRIAPQVIRYTQLFTDMESQPLGRGLMLITKAMRLQFDSCQPPEDTYGTFNFEPNNPTMTHHVQRLIAPCLTDIREAYTATKILQN